MASVFEDRFGYAFGLLDGNPLNLDNLGIGTNNTPDPMDALSTNDLINAITGGSDKLLYSESDSKPTGVSEPGIASGKTQSVKKASGNPADALGFDISGWFSRAVIVILGFIFVGVGLSMFRSGNTVIQTIKEKAAK